MDHSPDSDHAHFIRGMFARISRKYDLLNRLMTFGQDLRWRRQAVNLLGPSSSSRILDVGAGTGDLSVEITRRAPGATVVAVDFTPEMIAQARERGQKPAIHWVVADAEHLPFPANTFDGVISGFLLRNLRRVDRALKEQARILRPGCKMISLDAVRADERRRNPVLKTYFQFVIPLMGRLVAGDAEAYNYLPSSMDAFLSTQELSDRMVRIGFKNVESAELMFGTVAIHQGCAAQDHPQSQREG